MNTEQCVVEGEHFSRTVWFSAGPKETNHPLCVFLDGEHYLETVQALSIVEKAMVNGHLPQMSLPFVSHNGAAARHEDYTCNDSFASFVADDLVRWAKTRVPSITSGGNVICGISLSGLASAHIALTFPNVFSSSLCQSGSFWWNRQRFAELARTHSKISPRFWLSVGDKETEDDVRHPPTEMHQEISQIAGVESAADTLRGGSAEVRYHQYSGGHEFGPWIDELEEALQWVIGNAPAS
jgi:enterochelin esterase-like enzyme